MNSITQTWTPSPEEQAHLESYNNKINYLIDYAAMAHSRRAYGVYIYGRPGISKTHSIRAYLDSVDPTYRYVAGKITPRALFETIESYPDATIVLDDVSALFEDRTAIGLLLSALSAPAEGQSARIVSYLKANEHARVPFTGAVIAISNLTLKGHSKRLIEALKSRCLILQHRPSNEEVSAFLMELASQGVAGTNAENSMMVARFLIEEIKKTGQEDILSIRLFVDKALVLFQSWQAKEIRHHWQDMVRAMIAEEAITATHVLQEMKQTIRTVKADNKEQVLAIIQREPKPTLQLELAKAELGISKATFFNYKKELSQAGLIQV